MTTYAICNAGGPISKRIDDDIDIRDMLHMIDTDGRAWIDAPEIDAEDDLGFCGANFSALQMEAKMDDLGFSEIWNDGHQNGWAIWQN